MTAPLYRPRFLIPAGLRLHYLPARLLLAVTAAVLGGCQLIPPATADATRFYVLGSPTALTPAASSTAPAADARRWQLAVAPVLLPAYLRQSRSLVTRNEGNEIRYQDQARWAEPLDAGIGRVLAETLAQSPRVASAAELRLSPAARRERDVFVKVIQCEAVRGDALVIRFVAQYHLAPPDGSAPQVREQVFVAPETTWDGKDHGALARGLGEAIQALADRIAADLPQ